MTFKDTLEKFISTGLELGKVDVAYELHFYLDRLNFTDDEFETACQYLYDYYIASEIGAQELVDKFIIGFEEEMFTIDDCANDYEKVDEAIYSLL